MATHSSILPLEIPWTEEPGKHGIAKQSDTTWRVNNSNRVGIQTPLRAAGRARPARTALLPGLPAGAPPASVKKSRCIRRLCACTDSRHPCISYADANPQTTVCF